MQSYSYVFISFVLYFSLLVPNQSEKSKFGLIWNIITKLEPNFKFGTELISEIGCIIAWTFWSIHDPGSGTLFQGLRANQSRGFQQTDHRQDRIWRAYDDAVLAQKRLE